jgi:Family of unknown function (DUF5677)
MIAKVEGLAEMVWNTVTVDLAGRFPAAREAHAARRADARIRVAIRIIATCTRSLAFRGQTVAELSRDCERSSRSALRGDAALHWQLSPRSSPPPIYWSNGIRWRLHVHARLRGGAAVPLLRVQKHHAALRTGKEARLVAGSIPAHYGHAVIALIAAHPAFPLGVVCTMNRIVKIFCRSRPSSASGPTILDDFSLKIRPTCAIRDIVTSRSLSMTERAKKIAPMLAQLVASYTAETTRGFSREERSHAARIAREPHHNWDGAIHTPKCLSSRTVEAGLICEVCRGSFTSVTKVGCFVEVTSYVRHVNKISAEIEDDIVARQVDLLERVVNACFDESSRFEQNDGSMAQAISVSLHWTVIELTHACSTLVVNGAYSAVPIVMRSLLEASIDQANLLKDSAYLGNMEAADHAQFVNLLGAGVEGKNPFLRGIAEKHDLPAEIRQREERIATLKTEGRESLSVRKRFSLAKLDDQYPSVYALLCLDSHNNLSALAERHMGEKADGQHELFLFREPPIKTLRNRLDAVISTALSSAESIHLSLKTNSGAFRDLRTEHLALRAEVISNRNQE